MFNIFKTKKNLIKKIKEQEAEIKSLRKDIDALRVSHVAKMGLHTDLYNATVSIYEKIIQTLAKSLFDNEITARKVNIYCNKHPEIDAEKFMSIVYDETKTV